MQNKQKFSVHLLYEAIFSLIVIKFYMKIIIIQFFSFSSIASLPPVFVHFISLP